MDEYIEESNILNDIEKEQYLIYIKNADVFQYIDIDKEITEIFINPVNPDMKTLYCIDYNYCKKFSYNEDAIINFFNCFCNRKRMSKIHEFIKNEYYKSKVKSECPICYDNTSCYRFFQCNHVQCYDCFLKMDKLKCVYRCNT
jgi:hypothetical protein